MAAVCRVVNSHLYDGGIHIPLIIRWPGKVKPGTVKEGMTSAIDISKTIADVTGAKITHPIHGKNLFDKEIEKRQYIFAARGKMDNTHDAIRAIRSKVFKLMPERAYLQFNYYKEGKPIPTCQG